MTVEEFNAHPKKRGWAGIKAIAFEKSGTTCITPCPYNQKTPGQKIDKIFREHGIENFGSDDDCAMVGSQGCACCCFSLGFSNEGWKLCGYEANKSLWKTDSLGLPCGKYKTPRKLK